MTRTLLSIALFLFAFSGFAQQYDFAPVGARWTYEAYAPTPGGSIIYPIVVEVESEEVFQGQLCRKLTGIIGEGLPNPLYVYSQNDSVFFYSEVSENFELLYDFGAVSGESWTIKGLFGPPFKDNITIGVESTSFQQPIGDTSVVVMEVTISPLLPFEWGLQIYKGIGNNLFHLPYSYDLAGPIILRELRCYFDGENEFQFVPYACDTSIITSTREPEIADSEVVVFPNPVGDLLKVSINASPNDFQFILYNALGQMVRLEWLKSGIHEVPVSNLPDGMYYWEVTTRSGNRNTGKLIKASR